MLERSYGAALVFLTPETLLNLDEVKVKIEKFLLSGRSVMFYWDDSMFRGLHLNPEAIVVTLFKIGLTGNDDLFKWEYSGTGCLRSFDTSNSYKRTFLWIVVRLLGDKAYKRIKTVHSEVLKKSKLPVQDHAFTRDVANNVWHCYDSSVTQTIESRFIALSAWSDECYLKFTGGRMYKKEVKALELYEAPIPKARKVSYSG
jgi:hypothetical protein